MFNFFVLRKSTYDLVSGMGCVKNCAWIKYWLLTSFFQFQGTSERPKLNTSKCKGVIIDIFGQNCSSGSKSSYFSNFKNKIYLSIKEEIAEVGVFSSRLETKRMLKRNKQTYCTVGSGLFTKLRI